MSNEFSLVVDGGGTKTAVVIHGADDPSSLNFKGYSGPSNIFSLTELDVVDAIVLAIQNALNSRNESLPGITGLNAESVAFSEAYIGLAGALSTEEAKLDRVRSLLQKRLKVAKMKLMSDLLLIPLALTKGTDRKYCITLIAGTGSSALCFEYGSERNIELLARSGGWGPLFGDEGGGYSVGRSAVRSTLKALDLYVIQKSLGKSVQLKSIHKRVYTAITKEDSNVSLKSFLASIDTISKDSTSLRTILASLSKDIFKELNSTDGSEKVAKYILQQEMNSLVRLIIPLIELVDTSQCTLALSGTLLSLDPYYSMLKEQLEHHQIRFKNIETIFDPSLGALQNMIQ